MQLPAQINEAGAPPSPSSTSSPGSDPDRSNNNSKTDTAKPVKVLPCPRCESMNTKFCYYNNYSVTQPRHFCRQCQRYWTAGGTLRNVPVGGGSRKKNRHHPRGAGEPYNSQRLPGAAAAGSSGSPGFPQSLATLQNNYGGFHMQQENNLVALNLAQLPGFGSHGQYNVAPYGLDQLSQLSPAVYASILNKPPQILETESSTPSLHATPSLHSTPMFGSTSTGPMSAPSSSISPGGYFQSSVPSSFQNDAVKPEFWPVTTSMAAPQGNLHNGTPGSNISYPKLNGGRFESSMLLNLGLNNQVQWDRSTSSHHGDVKPSASTTVKNGSSPLHGSSIEDEGSTPSNGFSRSGYEEGDAVSSMWHSLHDMDNLHLSVKW